MSGRTNRCSEADRRGRMHAADSRGEDHKEAVALLARVDQSLSTVLARLLALKTPAGYQPRTVSRQQVTAAGRQADQLISAARSAS